MGTGEHRPSDRPSDRPRARPEARPGRLLRTIARHLPILVVLLLAVALRVVAWYAVHPSWWILGDSIGYLDDAIHLQPDRWRPSGYSFLLLRPLLPPIPKGWLSCRRELLVTKPASDTKPLALNLVPARPIH